VQVNDAFATVRDFHGKMSAPVADRPRLLPCDPKAAQNLAAGLPAAELFSEVHRSNMTKEPVAGGAGKVRQGPGYAPPDLAPILVAAGGYARFV
jgi:predicted HAD superfamily Cof-like phosphohydrolase